MRIPLNINVLEDYKMIAAEYVHLDIYKIFDGLVSDSCTFSKYIGISAQND